MLWSFRKTNTTHACFNIHFLSHKIPVVSTNINYYAFTNGWCIVMQKRFFKIKGEKFLFSSSINGSDRAKIFLWHVQFYWICIESLSELANYSTQCYKFARVALYSLKRKETAGGICLGLNISFCPISKKNSFDIIFQRKWFVLVSWWCRSCWQIFENIDMYWACWNNGLVSNVCHNLRLNENPWKDFANNWTLNVLYAIYT